MKVLYNVLMLKQIKLRTNNNLKPVLDTHMLDKDYNYISMSIFWSLLREQRAARVHTGDF